MWLRLILGSLYLAMAAGQLASAPAMPDIIRSYELIPEPFVIPFIVALITSEAVAGIWLVAKPKSKDLAPVWIYTIVAVVWTVLAVQGYARGLTVENCGCFGVYLSQPLGWWILPQDALMLFYGFVLFWTARRGKDTSADGSPTDSPAEKSDSVIELSAPQVKGQQ